MEQIFSPFSPKRPKDSNRLVFWSVHFFRYLDFYDHASPVEGFGCIFFRSTLTDQWLEKVPCGTPAATWRLFLSQGHLMGTAEPIECDVSQGECGLWDECTRDCWSAASGLMCTVVPVPPPLPPPPFLRGLKLAFKSKSAVFFFLSIPWLLWSR